MATLKIVPITFNNIFNIANVNEVWNSSKLSKANVLYVVSAPKKPVIKKALNSLDGVYVMKIATKIPIMKLPIILTLEVAIGIDDG